MRLSISLAALALFLAVVALVGFLDRLALIGECGVGPAAPSSCTWEDAR